MTDRIELLMTCEHGGNHVPIRYRRLFQGKQDLLRTHRGYDIGALDFAESLSHALGAPLLTGTVTRLLVDLNRSVNSRTLFSEISGNLQMEEKKEILRKFYFPYRRAAEGHVESVLSRGRSLLHLSIHSFTPILHGQERNCDLGLLYDPGRPLEKKFSLIWQKVLREEASDIRVRRNYPYCGVSDCLVRGFRRRYSPDRYLGLELEINQNLPLLHPERWQKVRQILGDTLPRAFSGCVPGGR